MTRMLMCVMFVMFHILSRARLAQQSQHGHNILSRLPTCIKARYDKNMDQRQNVHDMSCHVMSCHVMSCHVIQMSYRCHVKIL
jgi:hypothetical protein